MHITCFTFKTIHFILFDIFITKRIYTLQLTFHFSYTRTLNLTLKSQPPGKMAGVISERDYIKKVSLLGKTSKETKIKEIFTQDANVVVATVDDSIDVAMEKMMAKSIRHLPIVDNDKNLVGFVSIKDLIKEVVTDKEETLRALSDSVFGKGSWLNEGMIDWL